MKPEIRSKDLLKFIKAQAKMWEYDLPKEDHNVNFPADPSTLFPLTIGLLGDLCRNINNGEETTNFDKLFSPQFFDAFANAKCDTKTNDCLFLLGASAFYLADMPGNASVLAHKISSDLFIDAEHLELLLQQILIGHLETLSELESPYKQFITNIKEQYLSYFCTGENVDSLLSSINKLRKAVYEFSNPISILIVDIISAVIRKKIANSTWNLLPKYSNLSIDVWKSTLKTDNFVKELWPAQILIGEAGCYRGNSAVIQMPTSAGKTKSTEIILRSAFLSDRNVQLAVIIAPFCALCHEIKDSLHMAFKDDLANVCELSDVLQMDFIQELAELFEEKPIIQHHILILTPEKMLYILRHVPDLASKIGLIIFDEAHQFDSGKRGIIYELLLTELKMILPASTQKILISAVISNAEDIAEWFDGTKIVVRGENLATIPKSVGFAHWTDKKGQISYRDNANIDNEDFSIPDVIDEIILNKKANEYKNRIFPKKNDSASISLYLGLKLVKNGTIAIYCSRKDTAAKLSKILTDILERNIPLNMPIDYSDKDEINSLYNLQAANLGHNTDITKSAKVGIFQHHGNIPHGIRVAVEYAIKEGLAKFVICTSTLAQGVNLPIRYLIITNSYQGGKQIKVRDFNNLIGRAGRSGKHIEGSILFANNALYDERMSVNWRWQKTKKLLDISKAESCTSSLLDLFLPIISDNGQKQISIKISDLVELILEENINELINNIKNQFEKDGFNKKIGQQLIYKKEQISAIESFLLSQKSINHIYVETKTPIELASQTLAYYLSDEARRKEICEVFTIISNNIDKKLISSDKRKIYGKTLLDFETLEKIENWVKNNIIYINSANNSFEMLDTLWGILPQYLNRDLANDIDIVKYWISGIPFFEIAEKLKISVDSIVDLLENKLAFEASLFFSAIVDIISEIDEVTENAKNLIKLLQQQIKYGLSDKIEIIIYEMGFVDRVIVADLKKSLNINTQNRYYIKQILKTNAAKNLMLKYPSYFRQCQETL